MVGPYDLVHPLLNLLEILIGQLPARYRLARLRIGRFGEVKVVIEAIVDPRADGNLSFWEDLLHCHGHHVRGRVTETEQIVVVFVGREIFLDCLLTGLLSDGGRRRVVAWRENHRDWYEGDTFPSPSSARNAESLLPFAAAADGTRRLAREEKARHDP